MESRTLSHSFFLKKSVETWFFTATIGVWIFGYYVIQFYGSTALAGDWASWNEAMPHGHIPGDSINNGAMIAHILIAAVVLVGGPLQFIEWLRIKARRFHRLNGKIYIISAFLLGINGIFIVLYKGTVSGLLGDISMSINALLLIVCAYYSWIHAKKKDFKTHRKWSIRLFLVMSGVWFFRIGLMFWLFIHGEAVWFDMETFSGPFLTFLGFGQYIIPLILAEVYFIVDESPKKPIKHLFSIFMVLVTIITALGIFAATVGIWLPRIN